MRRYYVGAAMALVIALGAYGVKSNQGGGGQAGSTCATVTIRSVTWAFNKQVPCAQFVNGDWVVAPASGDSTVTITSMTPAQTASPLRNGWEVNPTDASNQAYDDRITSGGCCVDAALMPALPYAASVDSSIIKSISNPATCVTGNVPCLTDVEILTVLSSMPANVTQAFRPAWAGTSKRLFTTTQLQTGALPSLAPVGTPPTLASMQARMQRPQFDPMGNFLGRFAHPINAIYDPATGNEHGYGAQMSGDWNDAMLRLTLNDSLSAKTPLLNYVIQAGIDQYGWRKVPHTWGADGGHYVGRKILTAFAATLLNDSDMKSIAGDTGWDDNLYTSSILSTAGVSGRKYFNDSASAGMVLWGDSGCNQAAYDANQAPAGRGGGCRTARDPYEYIDGGETPGGTYQSCCTLANQRSSVLIGELVTGVATTYNLPDERRYIDRAMDFGAWTLPDPKSGQTCSGNPCRYQNGWTAQNGVMGTPTNGDSPFQNSMWSSYRQTSTFCGTAGCSATTTGASLATCATGTCTTGTFTYLTISGTPVAIYVPQNLQGTAPVVFTWGGSSSCDASPNWAATDHFGTANADAHRYMIVGMKCVSGAFDHAEDKTPTAGSDTTATANIVSYLNTHTFGPGGVVTPDSVRFYGIGGSTGAHQSRATLCSATTVGLFRAVTIVGGGAYDAVGHTWPYNVSSISDGKCYSQADKSIFIQLIGGTSNEQDPYHDNCGGVLQACTSGQTIAIYGFVNTALWQRLYFGCNATPTTTNTTVNGHNVATSDYTGCTGYPGATSPQFESVLVTGGHHSVPGLDGDTSTGWTGNKAATFWDGTTN